MARKMATLMVTAAMMTMTAAAAAAADDGCAEDRGGGRFMRCKEEEDIWVSFSQIPMYAYISSVRFV